MEMMEGNNSIAEMLKGHPSISVGIAKDELDIILIKVKNVEKAADFSLPSERKRMSLRSGTEMILKIPAKNMRAFIIDLMTIMAAREEAKNPDVKNNTYDA